MDIDTALNSGLASELMVLHSATSNLHRVRTLTVCNRECSIGYAKALCAGRMERLSALPCSTSGARPRVALPAGDSSEPRLRAAVRHWTSRRDRPECARRAEPGGNRAPRDAIALPPAATMPGRLPRGSRPHQAARRPLRRWCEFAAGSEAPHIVSLVGHGLQRRGGQPLCSPRREAAAHRHSSPISSKLSGSVNSL